MVYQWELAFDKLEFDGKGGMKLEASADKKLHGVADFKLECKSDLKTTDGISVGATYTGIANALIKAEGSVASTYSAEVSYPVGHGATVAVKTSQADMIA